MKKTLYIMLILLMARTPVLAIESVEFFSGYLKADLPEDGAVYEAVPFLLALNFEAFTFIRKAGSPSLKLSVEPFFNAVTTPERNTETGVNFLLKYILTPGKNIQPYLKAGIGLVHITQETRDQVDGFNFLPQAGLGCSFFIKENSALSLEYRFRHLSNAGFKRPNSGIDADMFLMGVKFTFN